MKKHSLLFTLLLALVVPMAALAQVERTVTVYNGTDKECHVPLYGYITRMEDLSLSQFIMDKSMLQAAGLAGKEITKMTFHLATPVPASYEWTTKRRTIVMLAEVDASEFSNGNFIPNADMTNSKTVAAVYLEAHGETMEISFSSPYTYSGEKNLLVYLGEEYMYYFGYNPFGTYRLPMYYGVYKTGASVWKQVKATDNYSTVSNLNCHFVPKTTFTYLTEANWANTKAPKNATTTSGYSIGNNINSFNYYIRMDWDASDNYTGNYQVLCVPRGTTPLDWTNAATTSDTFYLFEGLQKNTAYDLYVRAKSGLFFTSNVATASATTPFYPANLDDGPLTFDFNSQTMPNGLDFDCSIPRYLSAYGRLSYCNLGTTYNGATAYNTTPAITITLPELKFTNATNGLMVEFNLQGLGMSNYEQNTAELQVKIYDYNDNQEVFSQTVSASNQQHFTFRLPELNTSNYHIYKLSFSYEGGHGFILDNIVVRKAPNIMPPYNLAASEITPTSAKISWTDDNTNSHTFDLVYRQKGYSNDPNVWEHYVQGVTNPYYTLTGLTPYTDYEVKVKTITSSAYEDSEIYSFSTLCTPAEVPYNEPFTGLTTLPTDWRVNVPEYAEVVTEIDNGRLTMHNTVTEVTEYYYGYPFTYTLYSDFSAYIILPYFNNLGSLQLSFKAGRTQGALESLQVGVVADPKNYVSFTQIGTATLTDNANGEVYSFNLVNNAVQNGHIVIHFSNSDDVVQSIWLDDFSVQQYAAPTNLEVSNVTNTSATLGWNAGAATEWEVRYKATSASSWGGTIAVTEPTYNITGLAANTEYTAQVRAKYGDGLYSEWNDGDFGTFKTLMQAAVVMNAENASYYEDFESDSHGWILNNGGSTNYWCRSFGAGVLQQMMPQNGNKSIYITDGTTTGSSVGQRPAWKYTKMNENQFQNIARPSLVYLTKIFNLSAGQYTFNFDYKVRGNEGEDYLRVFLLPADMELNGTGSSTFPDGYENWYYLDNGTQVAQTPSNNSPSSAFVSFSGGTNLHNVVEVIPGGAIEPGNYMMVFAWRNTGTTNGLTNNPTQYPAAIDNVSVTWSSIIYAPGMALQGTTDTEATLSLIAPGLGIAPTSYEVQYIPESDYINNNNEYGDAPITAFNMTETSQTVTLTGLTPMTSYAVRVRSVYTANGHSVYSDWQNYGPLFTTKWPCPTNLALVEKTTSWANVMWTPVEMDLPSSQSIRYEYQLTTNPENWDVPTINIRNNSCPQNFAPGTYYIHVRTYVEEYTGTQLLPMGESEWTEPISFTIEPWTEPVSVFPLAYGFDEGLNRFADGITLGGDITLFNIVRYDNHQLPAHGGGESTYALAFGSDSPCESHLAFPPVYPSNGNGDLLVSFWWYHDNAETNNNVGVTIEYSYDGTTWQSAGDKIIRFADETGWVKYQQVVNADSSPTYVRLHFEGPDSYRPWDYCFLDDLDVYAFKSEQPYISYVDPSGNSATITLYDYAYDNGWPSSDFQVQYREYRDPGQTQEVWSDPLLFSNTEPYTFSNTLTVTGLQPTTLYEFRACARVSNGNEPLDWSNYCEPYRQWTSCGTQTITPEHSYTIDFEDEFYYNCWTGDIDETEWHVTTDDAHSGTKSFCVNGNTWKTLSTPTIDLTQLSKTNDNVVMRFWAKTSTTGCQVLVRYTYNGTTYNPRYMFIPKTDEWKQFEISLSKRMGNEITVEFKNGSNNTNFYLDDVEIVANPYSNTKIFDLGEDGYSANWTGSGNWFPDGTPDGNTNVRILEGSVTVQTNTEADAQSVFVGPNGRMTVKGTLNVDESLSSNIAKINTATNGEISGSIIIGSAGVLNAASLSVVDAYSFKVNDGGTANIGTLNPGEANSVIVKDGGLLNATTINGTTMGGNDKILIESGGQVKSGNAFYGIIKKNITGYGAENADNPTGWNLIATPTNVMAVQTLVPQSGSEYLFDQMDIYQFSGGNELEWDNFKCPFGGCDSPWGTIPQGHFSAEMGLPLKGYLYALQEDATIQFVAGPVGDIPFRATNEDTDVNLTCYNTPNDASLNGWNLIGNPYTCNAYLKQGSNYISFYKMNDAGNAIVGVPAGTPIKPCEGVFVRCTEPGSTVTFTTTESSVLGETPEDPMILLPTHVLYEDQDAGKMMEIILTEGWNWIAPTVEMSVEALQSVLGSDAVIQPEEGNTNATVAPGQMVKIHVDEDGAGAFTLLGRVVAANITIENGINWIGYTGAPELTIVEALGSSVAPALGDKIISQDEGFAVYGSNGWTGTLTTLVPGKGYVYFRNTSGD